MPTLEIDGKSITVEDGLNLIQAAERLGIEIPHYCYHPCLSISGNCRMCLVEIENMPKLQIACNTRATQGMIVRTQSERVQRIRAAVLEFLLINHPIDCPVCDQAGECKLQDYYMDYDRQPSRVPLEAKVRKSKAIDIGPLVMLDQERCILCSRCVRFTDEVTKTHELAIFQRGNKNRIDLFPGKRLDNPYSGNVVDICPVGALTNKSFRFRSRVWYLDHTPSVCPSCSTGCNIEIHHRRGEIFRFRPRQNDAVNQYWMCDEGRLGFQRYQGEGRLLQPTARDGEGWQSLAWDDVQGRILSRLDGKGASKGQGIGGIVSAQATNEEAFLFARFIERLGGKTAGLSWSPAEASRDQFLRDGDKNPNTAGLRALGIAPGDADALLNDAKEGRLRALVLFRADLAGPSGREFLQTLRQRVEVLVVADSHYSETAAVADFLLPVGTFAETDGTFVNRAGRVQRISAAFSPLGESRAGWQLLGEMLAGSGGEDAPADASAVFTRIAASVPVFRELSYASLGALGAPLAGAGAA